MENIIFDRRALPRALSALLPPDLLCAVELSGLSFVEEIRIRRDRRVWVSEGERNLALDFTVSREILEEILLRACGGSLYSAEESIKRGYVSFCEGLRVGVCGEWSEGGVRNVESLVIRIPRRVSLDVGFVRALLDSFSMSRGLLVFSKPLGGKTHFLRETARELSSGDRPLRVVVVDSRGEIGYSLEGEHCLCLLSKYPKSEGIEIAFRTLGAQVVICDEIGAGEVEIIRELHGGGVPLIASAHAADISDLLSKKGIDKLHRDGVFGAYIGLSRGSEPWYRCFAREDCLGF